MQVISAPMWARMPGFFRGHVEARGAGDVVAVEHGEGGEVELGGAGDQLFGGGGAFEEAESASSVSSMYVIGWRLMNADER